MTRPTILVPAYDFKPLLGGIANYGHELAVRFSREARVHVIAPDLPGSREFDREVPYAVTRVRARQSGLLTWPLFDRALRRLIPAEAPDVVFCPTWFPDAAAARRVLRGSATPYFVAAHGMELFDSFGTLKNTLKTVLTRRLKPRIFREARKIFPVSRYTRGVLLAEGCGTEESIVTVNNGVNPDIYRRMEPRPDAVAKYRPNGERLLLTVTRLYPYKGVDRMLESLPAIAAAVPDVVYLIAGSGPDRPRLETLTARLGLEGRVRFLGPLPLADIVELYNLADLFVMLSREELPDVEGFGLVFLEAAACGLPSVGGRSGGIPDAIEEGRSGWMVDPNDTTEIAARIGSLLASRETLARASAYCLATAPQKNWDQVADILLGEMFAASGPRGVPARG